MILTLTAITYYYCISHLVCTIPVQGKRLALLVGIGKYQSERIPTLKAPENDVDLMVNILSGPNGYGFQRSDLVVLKNETATLARFRREFEEKLIQAAQPDDVVLLYFSGHGSQVCDENGDEQGDGMDETLLFYDSRSEGQSDLVDDELRILINRIKAKHVVVILDSCHSGSGTRQSSSKWVKPLDCGPGTQVGHLDPLGHDDDETGMLVPGKDHPGLIVISAVADDGRAAFERDGASNLTAALAMVLAQPTPLALNYEQLKFRVRDRISAFGQIPSFQGALQQVVFANEQRILPISWLIATVEAGVVVASGIPMPGWSRGGEVYIFDPETTLEDLCLRKNAKAVMNISESNINRVVLETDDAKIGTTIQPGDIVLLSRPGEDQNQLRIRIKHGGERGGFPPGRAKKIQTELSKNQHLVGLAALVQKDPDFTLARNETDKTLQVIGPEGALRIQIKSEEKEHEQVAWNLWLHALQRHLLQLSGKPGRGIKDRSLAVSVVPAFPQSEPGEDKIHCDRDAAFCLPVGMHFKIKVDYMAPESSPSLRIGGLILSSDGSIFGFPADGLYPVLKPGKSYVFDEEFEASPPFELADQVLIFGAATENQFSWHLFNHNAIEERRERNQEFQYLIDILVGKQRSGGLLKKKEEPWVLSRATLRVFETNEK